MYLTTIELAKKWNMTSRMIAYYCQTGRLKGAIKKGKTWLIPSHAEKPVDSRKKKQDSPIKNSIFKINDGDINKRDIELSSQDYSINELQQFTGISRETIRYYEELDLISPRRKEVNNYRVFNGFDIFHLLTIDFYKKRGFTSTEVKSFLNSHPIDLLKDTLTQKKQELQSTIDEYQNILNKVSETLAFAEEIEYSMNIFSLKFLPNYLIKETFTSFSAFHEYQEKVIHSFEATTDDLLSNIIRVIYFDEHGLHGSQMCVIEHLNNTNNTNIPCMHIRVSADNDDSTLINNLYEKSYQWAKENHVQLEGTVYIFIKLILFESGKPHSFYDVFLPII